MALPEVRALGSLKSASGATKLTLPAGTVEGDLLIAHCLSRGPSTATEAKAKPMAPGYRELLTLQSTNVRLTILWKIATGITARDEVETNNMGDCLITRVVGIKAGTFRAAKPFHLTESNAQTATTAVSITGLTTTQAECLILAFQSASAPDAASTADLSAVANASLGSIATQYNTSALAGDGGGFACVSGTKATAGVVSATTATAATSGTRANATIAINPTSSTETDETLYQLAGRSLYPTPINEVTDVGGLGRTSDYRLPIPFGTVKNGRIRFDHPLLKRVKIKAATIKETSAAGTVIATLKWEGATEIEIGKEGYVESDPIGVELTKGGTYFVSVYIVPLEEKYLLADRGGDIGFGEGASKDSGQRVKAEANYTASENAGGLIHGYGFTSLRGELTSGTKPTKLIGIFGTSIPAGAEDSVEEISSLPVHQAGYFERAIAGKLPILNLSHSGLGGILFPEQAATGTTETAKWRCVRNGLLNCTHVFWDHATNDFALSKTYAEIRVKFLESWYILAERSTTVYACTCLPRTKAGSGTKAKEAYNAKFGPETVKSEKQEYNEWLRDGAPINWETKEWQAKGTAEGATIARCPVYNGSGVQTSAGANASKHPLLGGVVDIAAVAEEYNAEKELWVWKAGFVQASETEGTGTHPIAAGHAAIAATIRGVMGISEGASGGPTVLGSRSPGLAGPMRVGNQTTGLTLA